MKMYSEDKIFDNKLSELIYDINPTINTNPKHISGNDERIEKEDNDISKIHKIHNTMKLMMLLQSSIAPHEKIDIINSCEDSHSIFKIKSGGLMTNWEFEEF
jgi:hypothetical protein